MVSCARERTDRSLDQAKQVQAPSVASGTSPPTPGDAKVPRLISGLARDETLRVNYGLYGCFTHVESRIEFRRTDDGAIEVHVVTGSGDPTTGSGVTRHVRLTAAQVADLEYDLECHRDEEESTTN
jgi:hypothetical protein